MINKFTLFSTNVLIRPVNFSLGNSDGSVSTTNSGATHSYSNFVAFGVVLSVSSEIAVALKPGDYVFYDSSQCYFVEVEKQIYHIVDFKKILGAFLS